MPLFVPKRVLVKKECHLAPRTKLYVANIQKYNPNAEVIYLKENFRYPDDLDPKGKYEYAKETVIIGERVEDFIRSFPSPGDIIEHFVTVVNTSWMCAYKCEFCYLQNSRPTEHLFYTNFHKLDTELETASYAHTAILTIWSLISFATKKQFPKIPENLMETSDWLREHFVEARINTDEKAVQSLFGKQKIIFERLKAHSSGIEIKDFIVDRERLQYLYNENKKFPLWLNTSEFQDPAAIEHLTGNLEYLLKLLPKFRELRLTIRTRSDNFDVLTRYPLFNRVQAIVDIDPQTTIDKYEPGTASLDERIELLEKIQNVDGLFLRIFMEPIYYYPNWDIEYIEMLRKVFTRIDSNKVGNVKIGFPRYTKQLKSMIEMHYPDTTLFNSDQELQEPESTKDARLRYSYDRRKEMFNIIKEELDKYSIKSIAFNSETPHFWDIAGLNKMVPINSSVYQYSGKETTAPELTGDVKGTTESEDATSSEDSMSDSLEYRAAYEFIQNEEEEIDDIKFNQADQNLNAVLSFDEESNKGFKEMGWTNMYAIRISEALNGAYTWKPIKIVGFLSLVDQPAPLEIDGEDISLAHLTIVDLDDSQIDCLRIPYQNIQPHLDKMRTSRQLFSFLGTIVSVNTSKRKSKQVYRFYIKKISDVVTAEDIIIYRPSHTVARHVWDDEMKKLSNRTVNFYIDQPWYRIETIKDEFKKKGITTNPIIQYIKGQVANELKIKELDKSAQQLGMAIEFAILQSLSQGRAQYSFKLHSLLIGPPNVGKGFIRQIAQILNPLWDELPSDSPKLTSAGLIGYVKRTSKKSISVPGVFPKASGGSVAIQDFHEIRHGKRKELFSIFSKMMEDGEVLDKTSANSIHEAIVSLHIDTNRYSQVYRDRKYNSFEDLDVPMNILSRFDFIMEIPKDAERQKDTSMAMASGTTLAEKQKEIPDWIKELKMMIAFLRTHYQSAVISDDIGNYIKQKLIEAIKPYENNLYFAANYEDMQNRISYSVQKMVKAIACANMEIQVTKEHVDYTFRFIDEKIKFIASIDTTDSDELSFMDINNVDQRRELLAKEFYGKQFTTKDAQEFISTKMDGEISDRTVRRDLENINAKLIDKKKGIWSLGSQAKSKK